MSGSRPYVTSMPERLLIIDDDPGILAIASEALSAYTVETAGTGAEALEKYQAQPFDAVVCDLGLPDMSGVDVVRRIRESNPAARVLIITGGDHQSGLIASLREKIIDFLPKPFELADLRAAVANLLACEANIEVISAMPNWIELRVPASFQVAARLGAYFEQLHAEIDETTRDNISTAFRELLNNAIEHGCCGDSRRQVTVCYLRLSRVILYRINDPGRGFDPRNLPHAAVANPPEEPLRHIDFRLENGMRPGGFGILCAQGIADELVYSEQGNEVIFARYIDGDPKD